MIIIILVILCIGCQFTRACRSPPSALLELVFAIAQKNVTNMESLLLERSTPGHPLYQQWLTFHEVGEISSNLAATETVTDWFTLNNISVIRRSKRGEYLKASANISQWEFLLSTSFSQHEVSPDASSNLNQHASNYPRRIIHHANTYSLPKHVSQHVSAVLNLAEKSAYSIHRASANTKPAAVTATAAGCRSCHPPRQTDPPYVRQLYRLPDCLDAHNQTQAVVETANQHFSYSDLHYFQQLYFPPTSPAPVASVSDPDGYATANCSSLHPCQEGNLLTQYLSATAPCVPIQYLYVAGEDPFVDWIVHFADLEDPPKVFVVPWYSIEQGRSAAVLEAFNTEAIKLALLGVTLIVASGSSGAANDASYCDTPSGSADQGHWPGTTTWTGKGYFPSFPATSPYVTAVGATMLRPLSDRNNDGDDSGSDSEQPSEEEVACMSNSGGVITSGGGFSTYYATPVWQKEAVSSYFSSSSSSSRGGKANSRGGRSGSGKGSHKNSGDSNRTRSSPALSAGYNRHGRGYPDVSLIGTNYHTIVNNRSVYQYGTEAAAAVFAGMVSLLNVERAKRNMSSVGFMNPTLYAYGVSSMSSGVVGDASVLINRRLTSSQLTHIANSRSLMPLYNDNLHGHNRCMAQQATTATSSGEINPTSVVCCTSGFYCSEGWDPVTGWGSVTYPNLQYIFGIHNPDESGSNHSVYTSGTFIAVVVVSGGLLLVALVAVGLAGYYYFGGERLRRRRADSDSDFHSTVSSNIEM